MKCACSEDMTLRFDYNNMMAEFVGEKEGLTAADLEAVRQKAEANAYIAKDGLHLEIQRDQFIRTSVTRSRIEKESSGSGSSRRESGGGGSGRSGRF